VHIPVLEWKVRKVCDAASKVGQIENGSERCNRHIEALLALALTGQVPDEVREIDILGVVQEVVKENAPYITSKGIEVRHGGELGKVIADDMHMVQLFSNLLSNAVKYNDSDDPVVEVDYEGRDKSGAHHYRIKDNGSGILVPSTGLRTRHSGRAGPITSGG